jgi:4-hydroxybenzoate polyprenyltransferase
MKENFKQFSQSLASVLSRIESSKVSGLYFAFTFLMIMAIRNFLEHFSNHSTLEFSNILHFNLSFFYIAVQITLIVALFLKDDLEKLARVTFLFFSIILVPPLFDLILSGGKGYTMTYYIPHIHQDLFTKYLTFWGNYEGSGATPGIKIEVFCGMIGAFFYTLYKKEKVWKGLLLAWSIYTAIFIFGMTPFLWKSLIGLFGLQYKLTNQYFSFFFLLALLPQMGVLFYLYRPHIFKSLMKDLRITRMIHYQLMFFLGLILGDLAGFRSTSWSIDLWAVLIFFPLSLFFACLFSIVINNIADKNIDKISNPERPLITGDIHPKTYLKCGVLFLGCSWIYSGILGFQWFFFNTLFIALYFIYSAPPLRLKRIPFLSKLVLGLASYVIVLIGYYSTTKSFRLDPKISWPLIIGLTFVLNFIDIKDELGDRFDNIKTLPTIFGLWWSKRIIGVFFLVLYPLSFLWLESIKPLENFFLPFLALTGLLQYYFMTRDSYDERPIFYIHIATFSGLLLFLYY